MTIVDSLYIAGQEGITKGCLEKMITQEMNEEMEYKTLAKRLKKKQ